MKNTEERWGDFTFEEPQEACFLALPNSVMEHICRYLEKTSDKYEACFIHRQWTTAAQNVLWEKPRFEMPLNLRSFLKSIQETKKTALLVRDVYLAFLDHEETLFKTIVKSNIKRHGPESNVLSNPDFMSRVAKTCEKLNTLTVYGWNLETAHIDGLASTAQDLTSLYIIGAKLKHQLTFNNLFSRLTSLRLDGIFNLDEKWASSLVNKAIHLTELQLSLKNIKIEVLVKICTPQKLALTHLIFTDAENISDHYVQNVLYAFPHLTRFCLEGSIRVTALSILYALKSCLKLNTIEIRAHPSSLLYEPQDNSFAHFNNSLYDPSYANPCRVLIENLNLNDDQLMTLSPYLLLVQTVAFKNCPQLTSAGIEKCFIDNRYIRIFQSINCPNIDSNILKAFSTMSGISRSLYRIHLESSGPVIPKDVYELCCNSIEYNLRQIRLVNYDNIQQSVIGNYNEISPNQPYRDDRNNNLSVITLNRAAIDALAHTTDPELCPLPEDRLITGSTMLRLSEHFKVDLNDFLDLLDSFEKESEHVNKLINHKGISFDSSANLATVDKPAYREYASKSHSSSFRSTTPALWSQHLHHNDIINNDDGNSDEASNINEDETDDSQEAIEEEEEEEETTSHLTDIDTKKWESNPSVPNTGSEINSALGGWGVSVTDHWEANPKHHQHDLAARTPSPSQKERKSKTNHWTGYTEEVYTDQWQQNSLTVNNTKATPKRAPKHYRNSPVFAESDGWGSTDNYVPWHNVQDQGFVKEVIEQQQKTRYWNGEVYINSGLATSTMNDYDNDITVIESSGTTTPVSPPMLFSDLANNIQSTNSNSNLNHIQVITTRPRSESLISSDGSVSWNESSTENVIKVGTNKAATTPKFSVDKKSKSETPLRSRWATAEDWNALKQSTSDTPQPPSNTSIPKQGSWQDNFSPEVIADKTAKNGWSSLSANASNMPRRTTFSRPNRRARESIPPATMSGNWGEYTNSPPSRVITTSPSQNAIKPQSAILVDTDNVPDIPSKPTTKGDVWESISTLDITPTANHVLIPQEASVTKKAPTEIIDWNSNELLAPKEEEDISNLFHFTDTITGTITDAEIKIKEQQHNNDNLVDFEGLIPSFSYSQPMASPILPFVNTPAVASYDIPQNDDSSVLDEICISKPIIFNESNLTESKVVTELMENNVTKPMENKVTEPTETTIGSPPHDNIDSSLLTDGKRRVKPVKITIMVEGEKHYLCIQDREDIHDVVTEFCTLHDILNQVEGISKEARKKRTIRQTKSILTPFGKKVKKKSVIP